MNLILTFHYQVSERMVSFIKYRPDTHVSYFTDSDNPVAGEESVLESILLALSDTQKDFYDIKKSDTKFKLFGLSTTPSIVIESYSSCSVPFVCKLQFGIDVMMGQRWEEYMVKCW